MKLENLDNKTELNDTSFQLHGTMRARIVYIVTHRAPEVRSTNLIENYS
jgi:hypothetical protein